VTDPRPLIAGNWKLNHGPSKAAAYFREFLPRLPAELAGSVAFFPPSLTLAAAKTALQDRPDVALGVQNVYWEATGAFTGEISSPIAVEAGATLVLVGHSERRHVFGETDEETSFKFDAALKAGLTPILCVGETLEQRENGEAVAVVERQLEAVVGGSQEIAISFALAYEPVWAIGTGKTASVADASEMHAHLRRSLVTTFGDQGKDIRILYGGSVKPDNAADLLAASDVNGLLVGGASLDPKGFAIICGMVA